MCNVKRTKHLVVSIGLLVGVSATAAERLDQLRVDQAIQIALQNHRSLQVSQAALDMAEAQFQQAMAAFGPRLSLDAATQRADQDRSFTVNGSVQTPATDLSSVPALAGLLGGLPQGAASIPGQTLAMDMKVKMFDRDLTKASLNFSYPLYTGGKEEAIKAMARKGADIAREEKRKNELEIVRDVRKYYTGAQFAEQMEQLASDTLERFQALEELTDRLYQNASLKVKKTDYLRSRTSTAITRSLWQEARYTRSLSKEALINAMGLPLNSAVSLAPEAALPAFDGDLEELIAEAMQFNPDKQRLELAVQAAEHKLDEAKSGYLPTVGIEASAYKLWNSFKDGLVNDDNRDGWSIGVGLKWELFDYGLTKAGVDAARAGKIKLEAQRELLDQGLALQIKDAFMRIQRSRAQVDANAKARAYAEENRKLNVRAYQEELVETKDVIEAQIIESLTCTSLYRARDELRSAVADLDYRLGQALQQRKP